MDRRKFIAGAGGVILSGGTSAVLAGTELAHPNPACKRTTRLTRGPYLTPNSMRRSDIREGVAGVPLKLELTMIDELWCKPLSDCVVDVWHCDANGLYSGVDNVAFDQGSLLITDQAPVDTKDKTFLRGHQVSGEDGKVEFMTIYPGWYMPRLTHIHVRVVWREIDWTELDTQLYLPNDVERAVYQTEPYAARGPNPIGLDRDIVMKGDAEATRDLTIGLEKDGDGFRGSFTIAATAI